MTHYPIPKGVSPETLREIIAGWAAVGADDEPQYTSDVEEETDISDAVGRQTQFLESADVLERDGQRHRLTDDGAILARALSAGDSERAREHCRELLRDWPVTREMEGVLRGNPVGRDRLTRHLAAVTEQDLDDGRVSSGIGSLVDLYEWAGVVKRDDADQYRLPAERASTETEIAELSRRLEETREALASEIEQASTDIETTVERAHDGTDDAVETAREALEQEIAAANEETEASLEQTAQTLAQMMATAESGVEQTVEGAIPEQPGDAAKPSDESASADSVAVGAEPKESVREADSTEVAAEAGETAQEADAAEATTGAEESVQETDSEPALEIRSGEEAGVVVDAESDTVAVDVDDGPTLELSLADSADEPEPMTDGGEPIEFEADDETLTLSLGNGSGVEVQSGDGQGVVLDAAAEPLEIEISGGPSIELSATEAAEDDGEAEAESDGEKTTEETGEAAEEAAEEAGEAAEEAAEEAGEAAESVAEGAGEAVEEATEEVAEETVEAAESVAEEAGKAAEEATEATEEVAEETGDAAESVAEEAGEAVEEATEATEKAAEEVGGEGGGETGEESGKEQGEEAKARVSTSRGGEDAVAVSLDLALDADSEELEELVRALRRALIDEMLASEDD